MVGVPYGRVVGGWASRGTLTCVWQTGGLRGEQKPYGRLPYDVPWGGSGVSGFRRDSRRGAAPYGRRTIWCCRKQGALRGMEAEKPYGRGTIWWADHMVGAAYGRAASGRKDHIW